MNTKPEFAGYIVYDAADQSTGVIYGLGPTADEAWQDFLSGMNMAGIEVVGEIDDSDISVKYPEQTPANRYRIKAASKALMDKVRSHGGDIGWDIVGGVACTPEEAEDDD